MANNLCLLQKEPLKKNQFTITGLDVEIRNKIDFNNVKTSTELIVIRFSELNCYNPVANFQRLKFHSHFIMICLDRFYIPI